MTCRSSAYVTAFFVSFSAAVALPYGACAQSAQSTVDRMASPFITKAEYDSLHEDLRRQNNASGSGLGRRMAPQFHGVSDANAAAQAAENARAHAVPRRIEPDKNTTAKSPSAEFLATQARFDNAQKSTLGLPTPQAVASGKGSQTQKEDSPGKGKPLTAEQQELLRLELAECQRSGRTPDQLTPAEIAALKAKAGVKP